MSFEEATAVPQPAAERLELTDPRAMRALAHPTRLSLLEHLHTEGPATATQLAELVGESPSACSYHLRALARWGLVQEAEGGRGRNRPWKLAFTSLSFSSTYGTAEQEAAASLLRRTVLERDERIVREFFEREHELPEDWQEAASFGSSVLTLTREELSELHGKLSELIKSYYRPGRAPGERRVDVIVRVLPRAD